MIGETLLRLRGINRGDRFTGIEALNHAGDNRVTGLFDPVKEQTAIQMAIDSGLETQESALAAQGHEFDTWLAQRASEVRQINEAGIPLVHSVNSIPYGTTPPTGGNVIQQIEDEDENAVQPNE